MTIARTTLLGLAAAATIIGASYGTAKLMSSRYETRHIGDQLYVVDRLMGDVRVCDSLGCSTLDRDLVPPATTGSTR